MQETRRRLTLTARRMLAAREIKTSLANAEADLQEPDLDDDRREELENLINSLRDRLAKRRVVVLAARQAGIQTWVFQRLRKTRTQPIWGFPSGYDPNEWQEPCEICRSVAWVAQPTDVPDLVAWSCRACPALPTEVPD